MRRAVRRLLPPGLRWRLAAWVAGVMLVSAGAIFLVIYEKTGSELRGQIDRDIAAETTQLSQALRSLGGADRSQIAAAARRYIRAQPYSATSTLLFMLIPGQTAVSNHPEVFSPVVREAGETPTAQAAENDLLRKLLTPRIGYSTQRVPDVGGMRIHERLATVGHVPVVVAAAEPLYTVERAQHGIARAYVLAGVLILALALAASYLAGARVSAPLRRLAKVAARVDAGDLEPRMDVSHRPRDELRVLGEAFNHMLDRLAKAFRSQREFVADASHELRTPLTVMRGQLEVLAAERGDLDPEVRRVTGLVQAEISRISRLVDDLLTLAQAEQAHFLRREQIDLPSFVTDLWAGVGLMAERRYEIGPIPNGTLVADPDHLAQAIRNLARNAIEHTADQTGLVRLDVDRVAPDAVRFAVTDDGPGIPVGERERVFERFHRTDAARSRAAGGTGLGLAIVHAIAAAHGGYARVADSGEAQGVRVELVLAGFTPSPGAYDRGESDSAQARESGLAAVAPQRLRR